MTATAELNYRLCDSSAIDGKVSDSSTNGEITGYAAIWDVRDLDGDIIRRGSFKRAIDNQLAAGKVLLLVKHMRDGGDTTSAIGEIAEGKEDEIGFWIRAKLFATQAAQDIRQGVVEAPQAYGMSVGWRDVQGGKTPLSDGMGYQYTEMNLKEVTLTLLPAQEDTLGTVRGKSEAESLREQIKELAERLDALEAKGQESEAQDVATEEAASSEPVEVVPVESAEDDSLELMEMELSLLEMERKSL